MTSAITSICWDIHFLNTLYIKLKYQSIFMVGACWLNEIWNDLEIVFYKFQDVLKLSHEEFFRKNYSDTKVFNISTYLSGVTVIAFPSLIEKEEDFRGNVTLGLENVRTVPG